VWKKLKTLPAGTIPAEPARHLSRMAAMWDFRMLHLQGRLVQALAALAEVGIEVVLLKGAGLASTVYGSFAERPMYDLDLLVRPEHADAAWNTLLRAGWTHDEEARPAEFYREHHHLPPLDDPSGTGLSLELHTSPWSGAVELSNDAMWELARPVEIGGRRAFVPCVSHQILHLATHFAWSHVFRSGAWRTCRDLRQLVSGAEVDWEEFVHLARDARGTTCCYWTFSIARSLANVAIPDSVLEALRPPRPQPILRALERHFTGVLFRFGPAQCPSIRVEKALWSAGICPRWSGHHRLRPWTRDPIWASLRGEPGPVALRARLRRHLTRASAWGDYLAAVVAGP
jgi:hypothetical protein